MILECLRIVGFNFIRMKTHDQLFDKYYHILVRFTSVAVEF